MHRKHLLAGLMAAAVAGHASAAATIDLLQVGADVIASGSGSFNLAGFGSSYSLGGQSTEIFPLFSGIVVGGSPTSYSATAYRRVNPPTPAFGTGFPTTASSTSGSVFGTNGMDLIVPTGYVSGSSLSGSATWAGTTFSALGVTPGTYVWTWGSGATADTLTLNVGPVTVTPVPEPGTWALMAAGLGVIGVGARRRKAKATTAA